MKGMTLMSCLKSYELVSKSLTFYQSFRLGHMWFRDKVKNTRGIYSVPMNFDEHLWD